MAIELLTELRALGVMLSIDADRRLTYDAPEGAVSDELLARMRAERDGLLAALARPEPSVGRVVHCKREPFDVMIDRSTKWGNPFKIGRRRDGDRADVIQKYRRWILSQPDLMAALPELRGKRLGCWCSPLACHGDVLLEMIERGVNGPEYLTPMPGVICPWCRSSGYLLDYSKGLRCDQCDRDAFRFEGDAFVRVDYVEMIEVDWPVIVQATESDKRPAKTGRERSQTDLVFDS